MSLTRAGAKRYDHRTDYDRVGRFLVRTYRDSGRHINWLQPRWEYMHFHPYVRQVDRDAIGLWEADGRIVGLAHPEHSMGTAYFQFDPEYGALRGEMLGYAEQHLSTLQDGVRRLRLYINDEDQEFRDLASRAGYAAGPGDESMSVLPIEEALPAASPPPGFRLKSLAEDNDLRKVDRLLWRGFDHGDEPPPGGIEDRKFMQSAPNFAKDLNIVVEAPDGNFVSYCGTWFEPEHSVAYVEPVATDPGYRGMGLAGAAVLEGVRRCGERGAKVAYVGATMPFYLSLGFRPLYRTSAWHREWA